MVGGLGPESTVDYYSRIVKLYRKRTGDAGYPKLVIDSVDMTDLDEFLDGDLDGLVDFLLRSVVNLKNAGADFGFIASNTPHVVFGRLQRVSPLPLLSIVEAARLRAEALGLKKVGLIGTGFTMKSSFYGDEFSKSGIGVAVPDKPSQDYIQEKLFSEIELGVFKDGTREGLMGILKGLVDGEGIDGAVLGCTELPLILPEKGFGIPFLNTTAIHVERILDACLGDPDFER